MSSDLSFEGRSLVPAAVLRPRGSRSHRVRRDQRAAASSARRSPRRWKLIYYLNKQRLRAVRSRRPTRGRSTNLAPKHPPAARGACSRPLERWMDRVLYARDPHVQPGVPPDGRRHPRAPAAPPVASPGATLADGRIEVARHRPGRGQAARRGAKTDVHVYFRREPADHRCRSGSRSWSGRSTRPRRDDASNPAPPRSAAPLRATADGAFADRPLAGRATTSATASRVDHPGGLAGRAVGLAAGDRSERPPGPVTGRSASNDARHASSSAPCRGKLAPPPKP